MGAVQIKSSQGLDSNISLLSPELNQTDQQVLLDSLYDELLNIVGMPAKNANNNNSSNNGAAIMSAGWYAADARAKDTETLWKCSENDYLRVVLRICREMGALNMNLSDIDMKFTRRNYEDLLVKTQSLTNMLQAGIDPAKAIEHCGAFTDPNDVYESSKPYLQKWVYSDEDERLPEDSDEDDKPDSE